VVLANLGSESETCVGSRVHLVGASISFEKNFYRLPFTPPPSLVRCIGPSNPRFLHFMGKIPRYFSYLRPSTSSISAYIYFRWPIPTTNPKQSLLSTPLAHDYPVAHIFCSELLAPGRPFRALGSDTFVTVGWESNCQPPCS
jgi:hypothetical protein